MDTYSLTVQLFGLARTVPLCYKQGNVVISSYRSDMNLTAWLNMNQSQQLFAMALDGKWHPLLTTDTAPHRDPSTQATMNLDADTFATLVMVFNTHGLPWTAIKHQREIAA